MEARKKECAHLSTALKVKDNLPVAHTSNTLLPLKIIKKCQQKSQMKDICHK